MAKFKNKKPRVSRAGCFCGGKWDKKVTGYEKRKFAPEIEEPLSHTPRRKKNRKKWCRGKVGVEHDPKWIKDPRRTYHDHKGNRRDDEIWEWENYECQSCNKILGWRHVHLACGEPHDWKYLFHTIGPDGVVRREPFPCEQAA